MHRKTKQVWDLRYLLQQGLSAKYLASETYVITTNALSTGIREASY